MRSQLLIEIRFFITESQNKASPFMHAFPSLLPFLVQKREKPLFRRSSLSGRSNWQYSNYSIAHLNCIYYYGGCETTTNNSLVSSRPRPFDWGFRICLQKLRLSSVHPMSCQLDDIGCTKDKHNFEGKFGTINQKDEVWLRWGAPMLIGETRYLQTQFLAASWRVGIRELLPRGSFDCFIGSAIVGAAAVSRFRWRELLRRRHETLHAQFMT